MISRIFGILALGACLGTSGCGGPLPPPDPYNLAEAKDSLSRGNYWYERACYREAERFFQGGLESARLSDEVTLIIRAQNSLGAAALAQGELDAAAAYLEQALNLSSGHPGQAEMDKVLGNLGSLAFKLGRSQDAEAFWLEAVEKAVAQGQSPAAYYCDLARLYLAAGRTAEFSEMSAKALGAAETAGKPPALADALNLGGQQALAAGDPALAEERYRRALELDRKSENTVGLAQDTEALGLLMIRLERRAEAAGFLDRSFFLYLALGRDREAGRIFSHLQQLSREHQFPKKMEPYQAARRDPSPHRLSNQCP
ncbi:MAG: hypothetical protein LBP33_03460 [Candidatus Adiutrix sp.]|jgi:tetratricopeptide (TPR) repeat protein|nr:hypothetical protein [Candidatus Adiutrix sp.]